jgi:hypothetical protein
MRISYEKTIFWQILGEPIQNHFVKTLVSVYNWAQVNNCQLLINN